MTETDPPTHTIIGIFKCVNIHKRIDSDIIYITSPVNEILQAASVRSNTNNSTTSIIESRAICTSCFLKTKVANRYINPSINAKTNTVSTMIGSTMFKRVVVTNIFNQMFGGKGIGSSAGTSSVGVKSSSFSS